VFHVCILQVFVFSNKGPGRRAVSALTGRGPSGAGGCGKELRSAAQPVRVGAGWACRRRCGARRGDGMAGWVNAADGVGAGKARYSAESRIQ
jgi:hypothetical protein